eukprot:1185368-Prymnesium_polylepis.1
MPSQPTCCLARLSRSGTQKEHAKVRKVSQHANRLSCLCRRRVPPTPAVQLPARTGWSQGRAQRRGAQVDGRRDGRPCAADLGASRSAAVGRCGRAVRGGLVRRVVRGDGAIPPPVGRGRARGGGAERAVEGGRRRGGGGRGDGLARRRRAARRRRRQARAAAGARYPRGAKGHAGGAAAA